ncbi:hypothetical protein SADUNF_Sadunf10G0011000 [Salix dunnii]|uniref:VTT domain-containing protein n=1 Tax=Salix dunnii TaxID=1413687 RepID=A0A835MNQ0_9ROSI|nr:hypothetical protein SADUNF_Sadunf10G0011000 [Salix dunnii]
MGCGHLEVNSRRSDFHMLVHTTLWVRVGILYLFIGAMSYKVQASKTAWCYNHHMHDMHQKKMACSLFIFYFTLVKDVYGTGKRLQSHRTGFPTTVAWHLAKAHPFSLKEQKDNKYPPSHPFSFSFPETTRNLANLGGLRARLSLKQAVSDCQNDDEECRRWRFGLSSSMATFTWGSLLRITFFLLLIAAVVFGFVTLPVEKILKDFLLWVEQDLGPWGPLVLTIAYIPLTVLAVPASVLTLGGGYLFGLPVGFVADSIGATAGSGAAFLLGRTIGRSFVVSKLKDYPKFRSVAIATQKSGFKIVLLLRLVPLLPFNMLNYLLSVTTVPIGEYMLASWIGMMPITLAFVYIGTTLKDLSDVTHGWSEFSTTRWVYIILGLLLSVVLIYCVTKVAESALDKTLAENEDLDFILASSQLPIVADTPVNLNQPLIIKIEPSEDKHEK